MTTGKTIASTRWTFVGYLNSKRTPLAIWPDWEFCAFISLYTLRGNLYSHKTHLVALSWLHLHPTISTPGLLPVSSPGTPFQSSVLSWDTLSVQPFLWGHLKQHHLMAPLQIPLLECNHSLFGILMKHCSLTPLILNYPATGRGKSMPVLSVYPWPPPHSPIPNG